MEKYLENGQENIAYITTLLENVTNKHTAVMILIKEYGPMKMHPLKAMQIFDQVKS